MSTDVCPSTAAGVSVVSIIYSKDAVEWYEYFNKTLSRSRSNVTVKPFSDDDLPAVVAGKNTKLRREISKSKVIVVIASPGHLQLLNETAMASYHGLVTDPGRAVMFLCGTVPADFVDVRDASSRRSIVDMFPDFERWNKFNASEQKLLIEKVLQLLQTPGTSKRRPRRPVSELTLLPKVAICDVSYFLLVNLLRDKRLILN